MHVLARRARGRLHWAAPHWTFIAGLAWSIASVVQSAEKTPSGVIRLVDAEGKQNRYAVPEMKQVYVTFARQDIQLAGRDRIGFRGAKALALVGFDGRRMTVLVTGDDGDDQVVTGPGALVQLAGGTLRTITYNDGDKTTTLKPSPGSRIYLESGRRRLLILYDAAEPKKSAEKEGETAP